MLSLEIATNKQDHHHQQHRYSSSNRSSCHSKSSTRSSGTANTESTACESMGTLASEEFKGILNDTGSNISNTDNSNSDTTTTNSNSGNHSDAIYYFGYGPIVNPVVRYQRGCKIPPQSVQTATLYDYRLRFVRGGTATIVPARGWDVKGVLLRFESHSEWEAFREYDANYDVKEVSVSVSNTTTTSNNYNCNTGNDHQVEDDEEDSDSSSLDEEYYEEYSCPFGPGAKPRSEKKDPNAVKCRTFVMSDTTSLSSMSSSTSTRSSTRSSTSSNNALCKPQERYLKLMTDGLRAHHVDETYIRDEILTVGYIPSECDSANASGAYQKFPLATKPHKLPRISLAKYQTKLCNKLCNTNGNTQTTTTSSKTRSSTSSSSKHSNSTYFVCNHKVMRVDNSSSSNNINYNSNNACLKWLRARGHGRGDITLAVHRTFVDPDCCPHVPLVDTPEDLTPRHYEWAEHTILLYLKRGGLTATVVYDLTDAYNYANNYGCGTATGNTVPSNSNHSSSSTRLPNRKRSLSTSMVGKAVPSLTANMGRRFHIRNLFGDVSNHGNSSNNHHHNDTSSEHLPMNVSTNINDNDIDIDQSSKSRKQSRRRNSMPIKPARFGIGMMPRLKNLRFRTATSAPGA